jgi:hypothetical protein
LAIRPEADRPLVAGYDGPDPPGSTEAPLAQRRPFFRRLTGDGRINATVISAYVVRPHLDQEGIQVRNAVRIPS